MVNAPRFVPDELRVRKAIDSYVPTPEDLAECTSNLAVPACCACHMISETESFISLNPCGHVFHKRCFDAFEAGHSGMFLCKQCGCRNKGLIKLSFPQEAVRYRQDCRGALAAMEQRLQGFDRALARAEEAARSAFFLATRAIEEERIVLAAWEERWKEVDVMLREFNQFRKDASAAGASPGSGNTSAWARLVGPEGTTRHKASAKGVEKDRIVDIERDGLRARLYALPGEDGRPSSMFVCTRRAEGSERIPRIIGEEIRVVRGRHSAAPTEGEPQEDTVFPVPSEGEGC